MADKVWTISVTQLNTYIKQIVDAEEMLIGINVFGEVSNFKNLHSVTYFDLKDESSCISCVCFQYISTPIKNGDKVVVYGKLYYNTKSGKLGFLAKTIEPYGLGELYQQYVALKQKLQDEGLFDEQHKKPIPKYVKCIGVVTSTGGAVIKDIIRVVREKNKHITIMIYPSKIQGEGAVEEICKGITYFNQQQMVDCIILARGGGSFEDFAPFNTEMLARCIYKSTIPIVSAVGHETDYSISDFVADARAGTPSIAADMVAFNEADYANALYVHLQNIYTKLCQKIQGLQLKLGQTMHTITLQCEHKQAQGLQTIQAIWKNISTKLLHICENLRLQILVLQTSIEKQNPMSLLKKGYAKVSLQPTKSIENANVGDVVRIETAQKKIDANIIKVEDK